MAPGLFIVSVERGGHCCAIMWRLVPEISDQSGLTLSNLQSEFLFLGPKSWGEDTPKSTDFLFSAGKTLVEHKNTADLVLRPRKGGVQPAVERDLPKKCVMPLQSAGY
jgi:hypothetical protein